MVVFAVKSWLGEEARLQLSPYMAAEHAHKIHLLDGQTNTSWGAAVQHESS